MTLQPLWRRISTNKKVRCEEGDPFFQLLSQLDSLIVSWLEDGVNSAVGVVNSILSKIQILGRNPITWRLCLPTPSNRHRCDDHLTREEAARFAKCERSELAGGLDMLVSGERQRRSSLARPPTG